MEVERETGELRKILAGSADGMIVDGQEEKWMSEFEREGKRFLDQMLLIRSVFLQLDRTYVLNSAGLLSIW
jgi:cullin-4